MTYQTEANRRAENIRFICGMMDEAVKKIRDYSRCPNFTIRRNELGDIGDVLSRYLSEVPLKIQKQQGYDIERIREDFLRLTT
jgi:hypothetical protein